MNNVSDVHIFRKMLGQKNLITVSRLNTATTLSKIVKVLIQI